MQGLVKDVSSKSILGKFGGHLLMGLSPAVDCRAQTR